MHIKDAYNHAAKVYAQKYDLIPARSSEIDHVLTFFKPTDPRVLEIGYGSGREAEYILSLVSPKNYVGVDISEEMQAIAQQKNPNGTFLVGDIMKCNLAGKFDVVLAFASLLHLDEMEMREVFKKIYAVLNDSGVFFLSLKRRTQYMMEIDDDGVTARRFWYYNKEKLVEIAGELFAVVYYDEQDFHQPWLTIILRKK